MIPQDEAAFLPLPHYGGEETFGTLFRECARIAMGKAGVTADGTRYMDEGFNDNFFQWDTCFMALFGMYLPGLLPAMESLDNFYRRQRADGFISRVYNKTTGEGCQPSLEEPHVNPPLFAWVEWSYYERTGDGSRLERVLPVLELYYRWIKANCRRANGLYYNTNFGSGMDNSPRGPDSHSWTDMSSQQALAALCLSRVARAVRDGKREKYFIAEYKKLRALINRLMWDDRDGFYYDLRADGSFHRRKTIAGFWPLAARIPGRRRAERLIAFLEDERCFASPHLFPSLSRDDPDYDPRGHYWRGGVWAPTNCMVVRGLMEYGRLGFARRAALNHLRNMAEVYNNFIPGEGALAVNQENVPANGDGIRQIWECYSPEYPAPATRWDNRYYSRQQFVGWSGLGPIALLIESVIGLGLRGSESMIVWAPDPGTGCGVKALAFLGGMVSLDYSPESGGMVTVETDRRFILEIIIGKKRKRREILPGRTLWEIKNPRRQAREVG